MIPAPNRHTKTLQKVGGRIEIRAVAKSVFCILRGKIDFVVFPVLQFSNRPPTFCKFLLLCKKNDPPFFVSFWLYYFLQKLGGRSEIKQLVADPRTAKQPFEVAVNVTSTAKQSSHVVLASGKRGPMSRDRGLSGKMFTQQWFGCRAESQES